MSNTVSTNPKDAIGRTKPPLDLIPPAAMIEESVVMGLGAKKYGPYNWRSATVAARVYLGAALRHLMQELDGEAFDPESGASHAAHARACLGIYLDAKSLGTLVDDRPKPGRAAELIRQFTKMTPPPQDIRQSDGSYVAVTGSGQDGPVGGNGPDQLGVGPGVVVDRDDTGDFEYDEARKLAVCECVVCQPNLDRTGAWRELIFRDLLRYECPRNIAKLIAGGVTFSPTHDPSLKSRFVYVAGPMRGITDYNFPAFDAARDQFLANAWHVISPADIDRAAGDAVGVQEKDLPPAHVFVLRDFFTLYYITRECGGEGAIAMLPGWERSTGAVAEFFLARWLGLKVFDATTGQPLESYNQADLMLAINQFLAKSAGLL